MSTLPPALRWLATPFAAPYVAMTRGSNLEKLTEVAQRLGLRAVRVEGRGEHRFQGEVDGVRVHVDPVFKPLVYVLFDRQKPLMLDWSHHDSHVSSCSQFEPPHPEFGKFFRRSLVEFAHEQTLDEEQQAALAVELVEFSKRWRGTLDGLVVDSDGIVAHIGYVPFAASVAPETLAALVPDIVRLARSFDAFGADGAKVDRAGNFPQPVD